MPPAARVTDNHICPMFDGPKPHVGGPILPVGCPTVLIGGLPAARVGDMATCVGPPDVIVMGSPTVLIGCQPAARIGDNTAHGGMIVVGHPTVLIGIPGQGDCLRKAAEAGAPFVQRVSRQERLKKPKTRTPEQLRNIQSYLKYRQLRKKVGTLDVSTKENQAVFYSGKHNGRRNKETAEAFARANGKLTLEMTPGGKELEDLKLYENLNKKHADKLWKRLSERYAEQASGQVVGFVTGCDPKQIFETAEYPALLKNPNVKNVITGGY